MSRGRKWRIISSGIRPYTLVPQGTSSDNEPIMLTLDEVEAIRLSNLEGLTQEQAAVRMNISRKTFWTILSSARKKIAQALTEQKPIKIEKGNAITVEEAGMNGIAPSFRWHG